MVVVSGNRKYVRFGADGRKRTMYYDLVKLSLYLASISSLPANIDQLLGYLLSTAKSDASRAQFVDASVPDALLVPPEPTWFSQNKARTFQMKGKPADF